MIAPDSAPSRTRIEVLDTKPPISVDPAEYWRLLGYPPHHTPAERAQELAAAARAWYAQHGQPWIYLREVEAQIGADALRIDGVEFKSQPLHEHLRAYHAERALIVAVSAGPACEEEARRRWEASKPDEYFFLEIFGSAVVEHLISTLSGRICDEAERQGYVAVPHYSPGYAGWEVTDQHRLFERIRAGASYQFPEPIEVLSSGMLRPKKSLLAIVGLAPRHARPAQRTVPCEGCSYSPCQYRRAPYRHAGRKVAVAAAIQPEPSSSTPRVALTTNAQYSVNPRALQKWAAERVRLTPRPDGSIEAQFRFDGTTCSNQGRPLAFDYVVALRPAEEHYRIAAAECRPAEDDTGHRYMCSYLSDPDGLMAAIATENPLVGKPLDDVLRWKRASAPSGCYCAAESRAHKWGLALEAIHYALVQRVTASAKK